jgi:hypothetical protein
MAEKSVNQDLKEIETWFESLSDAHKMHVAHQLNELSQHGQTIMQDKVKQYEQEKQQLLAKYGLEEQIVADRQYTLTADPTSETKEDTETTSLEVQEKSGEEEDT